MGLLFDLRDDVDDIRTCRINPFLSKRKSENTSISQKMRISKKYCINMTASALL